MSYLEQRRHGKTHGFPEKEKNKKFINRKSEKKLAEERQKKEDGTDAAEDKWFDDRGKELTGRCLFCGAPTEKGKPMERCSIAHLFAKRDTEFPSIKLHPENSIELCFYNNSHHTNFDNKILTFQHIKDRYPQAWLEILRKTSILYPVMTQSEKNKVPEILLKALNIQP